MREMFTTVAVFVVVTCIGGMMALDIISGWIFKWEERKNAVHRKKETRED